jgi:predicted GIY-YIG superfamily endonuclease
MEKQLVMFAPKKPLVERFGAEFFRKVPERPGVYLLCGAGSGVLYVGKAKNLRQRLGDYRSANLDIVPRKLRRLLCAVERILWDECADESAALERERELLLTLQPRFNTVGVRAARRAPIGWRVEQGTVTLGCGALVNDWPGRFGPTVGATRIHASLLRLLWWTLHPTGHWAEMPRVFRTGRCPGEWSFSSAEAAEAGERLSLFFRGESPELVEWFVWSAARRTPFERQWIVQDAGWLLEFYEKSCVDTVKEDDVQLH